MQMEYEKKLGVVAFDIYFIYRDTFSLDVYKFCGIIYVGVLNLTNTIKCTHYTFKHSIEL